MRRMILGVVVLIFLMGLGVTSSGAQTGAYSNSITNDQTFVAYRISVDSAGQTLLADMRATSGNLDTLIYLLNSNQQTVAFNDDRVQGGFYKDTNALLIYDNLPVGDYFVVATRYNVDAGTTTGDFDLTIDFIEPGTLNDSYDVSDAALASAGFPQLEPREQAAWTVLAYYGGDTNLEPGVLNDFNEFELAGGSDNTVRVVAMVDRIPGYTDIAGDWEDTRLYEVSADVTGDTQNFPPTPDTEPLAELGELDMGDGEIFAQFLTWAIKTYPADRYAIAFASHGAGWQGLITDDTSNGNILSIPELQKAMQQAQAATNTPRFDLLINDACLMSSVEYYASMSQFFDITFASPELVVDPALDMTTFTNLIRQNPDTDLAQVGAELVDLYMNRDIQFMDAATQSYLNYAVTDLTMFDPVITATNDFAKLVNQNIESHGQVLGQARANAYTYGEYFGQNTQIDLGDFMRNIMQLSRDEAVRNAAQAVIDALNTSRVYAQAGTSVSSGASYYNIYFPANGTEFDRKYLVQNPLLDWGLMLEGYFANFTPRQGLRSGATSPDAKVPVDLASGNVFAAVIDDEPAATEVPDPTEEPVEEQATEEPIEAEPTDEPSPEPIDIPAEIADDEQILFHEPVPPIVNLTSVYPQRASSERPVSIQYEVIGRNIASGDLIVNQRRDDGSLIRYMELPLVYEALDDDGNYVTLNDWASGVDAGTIGWDVFLYALADDTQEHPEYFVESGNTLAVDGRYRPTPDASWTDATLVFDFETGRYQQAINESSATGALAPVRIPAGSEFQSYSYIILPDGTQTREPSHIYDFDSLVTVDTEAPTSEYDLGVQVTTFSGITSQDTIAVTVDNSLNIGLQTFSDVDFGFEFLLPDDWYYVEELLEDFAYVTFNEEETAAILVKPYKEDMDEFDLEDFVYFFVEESEYADELYEDSIELGEFDGEDAVLFEFYSEAFDWYWEGFGAVVYNEVTDTQLLVAIYIDEDEIENDDLIDETITIIDESFQFVKQGNTRAWEYTTVDGDGYIEMPARVDWEVYQESDEEESYLYVSTVEEYVPTEPFMEVYTFPSDGFSAEEELAFFSEEYVQTDLEDFTVTTPDIYYGEYETWNAIIYEGIYEGVPIVGRAYVTTFDGDFGEETVFVYFETPADNLDVIYDTFEPMIDGIRIYDEEDE